MVADSGRLYFSSAKFQVGNILIDNPSTAYLVQDNPLMLESNFSILNNTQCAWDYCNCYSKNGFAISYINLGNPTKLSQATRLVFTEPYLSFSFKLQFYFRDGAGIELKK